MTIFQGYKKFVSDMMVPRFLGDGKWRAPFMLGVGAFYLFLVGVYGIGRSAPGGMDSYFLYVAGATWLEGLNPYDMASRIQIIPQSGKAVYAFAYPPHIYPLATFLGIFTPAGSWMAITVVNVFCLGCLLYLCRLWIERYASTTQSNRLTVSKSAFMAACLVLPFTAHVIYMGQTSLIAIAALAWAWECSERKQNVAAGFLLSIALIKPQLCILVVIWFLLERRWATLTICGSFGLAFSLLSSMSIGVEELLGSWLQEVRAYKSSRLNSWGFNHMFGVPNVLHKIGVSTQFAWVLGIAALVLTWRLRERLLRSDVFPLLVGYALLFFGAHDYDLVAIIPLAAMLYCRAGIMHRKLSILIGVSFLSLYVPQRILRSLAAPLLLEYRVAAVMMMLGVLVFLSTRDRAEPKKLTRCDVGPDGI